MSLMELQFQLSCLSFESLFKKGLRKPVQEVHVDRPD